MKVLTVVGNRPQFIKAAPLSLALRAAGIEEVSLHTGQHYDRELSAVFYEELGLAAPAYALDTRSADPELMRPAIRAALEAEQPDVTLVFGDTNSTLAGATAGVEAAVPVAHVEAGLRSGDLAMPEERNRIAVDQVSGLLLCPDERSRETLLAEGVPGRIEVVGDVMADAVRLFAPLARARVRPAHAPRTYLLATVHREANVAQPRLGRIVEGLNRLEETVVFPIHPRTSAALEREGLALASHIELVEPLGYLELAALASQARVILTDSGGLQKEAYWYGVPCVTMRPSTEWIDTVEAGANVLVDDDPDALVGAVRDARMPPERPPLYGDGHASERVATALVDTISRRD
ncbi:MAG: UDP-N-acetylglucosamine 2-epimerase (non-hydrolyzing) [Actinobacteria bacterium]|nr:UDP-N-acetylglucosamine 2-epimerase (non-hydrolyzing) [Actinomycetota bacterium]